MARQYKPDTLRLQRQRYKTRRREREREWYRINSLGEHPPNAFACEICGDPEVEKRHAMDHNHTTGAKRGMLCFPCNAGIGLFRDRPDLLQSAAGYLERYAAK